LAAVGAVHLVVRAHDRPGPALLDGQLEWPQVELAQRALGDVAADRAPLVLRLVPGVVLHGRRDAALLQPRDVRRRELPGEERVLGVALEVATVEAVAEEVDGRPEQHPGPLVPRLPREVPPDLAE